jgi:two-component system, sensor histidine kinase
MGPVYLQIKLRKIFDRFERAKADNHVQGLDLGLYITKQIIEAHSGKIWVESELGKDSIFFIQNPCFTRVHGRSDEVQKNYLKEL